MDKIHTHFGMNVPTADMVYLTVGIAIKLSMLNALNVRHQ